jgi:hypothetical protein
VHNFWLSSQQNCLIEYLDNLASILVDQQVILFHSQDKFFGAVRIPAVAVFHNIMAVWEIVKEDIAMVTEDNNNGICIEKSYYDRSGNYYADGIYEFSRWGLFKDM